MLQQFLRLAESHHLDSREEAVGRSVNIFTVTLLCCEIPEHRAVIVLPRLGILRHISLPLLALFLQLGVERQTVSGNIIQHTTCTIVSPLLVGELIQRIDIVESDSSSHGIIYCVLLLASEPTLTRCPWYSVHGMIEQT